MKKTLITLLALAGLASADTFSAAIQRAEDNSSVTAVFGETSPIASMYFWNCKDGEGASLGYKNTTVNSLTLSPNINVGNGGTWYVDMQFNPQLGSIAEVQLTSITLTVYAFNGGGAAQNQDNLARDISFTLMQGENVLGTEVKALGQSSGNTNYQQDFEITFDEPLIVTSRLTPVFTLGVTKSLAEGDSSVGTYIGLSNVVVGASLPDDVVPEPATATLSLLALAGLAARRRRK